MKKNIASQRVIEWRKALKEKGWKQVSLLVPDADMADRLLKYRWLMMNNFRRSELEKETCD
jgi:hypothetical protein